ncbi:MAG: NAD(P)H-hydrate epimerase, partial [Porphyromonas sp.]
MQKIYAGKQLEILYAQAAQVDKLSAFDHIDRAASAFERELLRHYTLGGRTIYVFAGAGRCGAYALAIAQLLARRGHSVLTYLFYRSGQLSEACEEVRNQLPQEGFRLEEIFTEFTPPRIGARDLIIDGLFGAELQTPLADGYVALS